MGLKNSLTPENVITDMVRTSMIANDPAAGLTKMMRMTGFDPGSGGFNPIASAKGYAEGVSETARVADERMGWFSNKPVQIEAPLKDMMGNPLDKDGHTLYGEYYNKQGNLLESNGETEGWGREKWLKQHDIDESATKHYYIDDDLKSHYAEPAKKTISLTGKESMEERIGMFMDIHKDAFETPISNLAKIQENGGKSDIKDVESYKHYINNMDPGAIGTYKELDRAGFYGKDANVLKKTIGYGVETYSGSPAWARIADKQLSSGKASLERYVNEAGDSKVRFKGGGKAGRVAGIIADIATGGLINGALEVGIYGLSAPFAKNHNSVNANNALNPI